MSPAPKTRRVSDIELTGYCVTCGYSHRPEDRRRALARLLPCTVADICEAWPCWYEAGNTGAQRLRRDLLAMGATFVRVGVFAGMWTAQQVQERNAGGSQP